MKSAPVLLVILASAVMLSACERDTPRAATPSATETARDLDTEDPRYDFAGIASALSDDGIDFALLTAQQFGSVTFTQAQMLRKIARVMTAHPDHYVVGIHLGLVNMDSPRLQVKDRMSYVVEVTGGEPDGNCFDFYDATTGKSYLGSCFHTDRGNPYVRP